MPALAGSPACDTLTFPAQAESPVGTWTIGETLCMDLPDMGAMISPGCVGSTQDISMDYSGTVTFDAATYSREVSQTTAGAIRVPLTCLEAVQLGCEGEGPMGPATVDGDFCAISLVEEKDTTEAGAWEANEATLTLTPEGEGEEPKTLSIYADPADPATMWLEVHGRGGVGRIVMQLTQAE